MSRIVPENVQDRDKGILTPAPGTSVQASSYMGARKFSTSASPAGRKFNLGGWGAGSTSTSTPTLENRKQMSPPPILSAEEEAAKSFSSIILGAFALGSTIAGLLFGNLIVPSRRNI